MWLHLFYIKKVNSLKKKPQDVWELPPTFQTLPVHLHKMRNVCQ